MYVQYPLDICTCYCWCPNTTRQYGVWHSKLVWKLISWPRQL